MKVVPGPRWAGGVTGCMLGPCWKDGHRGGDLAECSGALGGLVVWLQAGYIHIQPLLGKAWSVGLWNTHGAPVAPGTCTAPCPCPYPPSWAPRAQLGPD